MKSSRPLLSGVLYYTPQNWSNADEGVKGILNMHFVESGSLVKDSKWHQFMFVSEKPLIDPNVEKCPFRYDIYYRQSARRALLLSSRRHISEEFVRQLSASLGLAPFEAVYVDIQGLVTLVCEKPGPYAITYLHARTTGLGNAVRSLSFYGDDVTGCSLYRSHAESLLAHTCGLRDVYGDRRITSEALRVSADGGVSFYYGQSDDLVAAERALHFIYQQGFLLEPKGVGPREAITVDNYREEEE